MPSRASSPSDHKDAYQRGVFHSLVDLQAAINRYLAEHNQAPKPFVWTASRRRSWPRSNAGIKR